jgi:hypothetical protein
MFVFFMSAGILIGDSLAAGIWMIDVWPELERYLISIGIPDVYG